VLMRLINGHRGAGLEGIKPVSDIPECRGMHGIYESGALDRLRHSPGFPTESIGTCNEHKSPAIQIEGGGVTIHRPLLQFSKNRLIATCLSTDTPWFEDHTNKNPTTTTRNAIRQLLKYGSLPEAIQKPSLLAISRRKREEKVGMIARTQRRILRCKVSFDTRSGRLFIRFPKGVLQGSHKSNTPEEYKERTRQRLMAMAALILRRFLEIVSPFENISLVKLQTAASRVFPEVFESGESRDDPGINSAESFTIAGVDIRKVASKDNVSGQREKEFQYEDHGWVLTRQPYGRFDPIPMISFLPGTHSKGSVLGSEGPWHFWDGRYWIRVYNHTTRLIIVRPFEPSDLTPFRSSLPRWVQQSFKDTLSVAAPGKARWTLPALVAEGEVVALPTLGFAVQSEEYRGLRWQIRYKKVDLGKDEEDPTKWWGGRYSRYLKARGINSET
jgi:tRNA(Ile)-lysidine synthase